MFDPFSISAAYQHALQLEKRRLGSYIQPSYGNTGSGGSNAGGSNARTANRVGSILNSTKKAGPSSGIKCFTCGEIGHR